jgi:hypothetical protein
LKDGDLKKATKFVPNAIYLAKEDIDFQAEKFEKEAEFVQNIIFTGVDRVKDEEADVADDEDDDFDDDAADDDDDDEE